MTLHELLVVLIAGLWPVALVLALLQWATRAQRTREAALARQIALTDAVHRELGAVVAPTVSRGRRGAWRVAIAVPFSQPVVVATVLSIVHRELMAGRWDGRRDAEVVLTEQTLPRSVQRRLPTTRDRALPRDWPSAVPVMVADGKGGHHGNG